MHKRSFMLVGLGGLLLSCTMQTAPQGAMSGSLEPKALQSQVTVGTSDTLGHTETQTNTGHLVLVSGHLPSQPFSAQKTAIASLVNGSSALDPSKKTELINQANSSLDQLESDLNGALDGIPRHMSLQLTGDRIGDLASANFQFQTKAGGLFVISPSGSVIAVYNVATTDYGITSFGFARGDGNANAILGAIAGCQFQGALNKTSATHTCTATGGFAINNVGAIALSINLSIELSFTRD